MSNVIAFRPRAVALLWSPRRGINPAWRLRAESRVLDLDIPWQGHQTLAWVAGYRLVRVPCGTFHVNAGGMNFGVFATRAEAEARMLELLDTQHAAGG